MEELTIVLACTRCDAYRDFERDSPGASAVRCARCGKRHSTDSLHAVQPSELEE